MARVSRAPVGTSADLHGIVQIAHGFGEHNGRYASLIEILFEARPVA